MSLKCGTVISQWKGVFRLQAPNPVTHVRARDPLRGHGPADGRSDRSVTKPSKWPRRTEIGSACVSFWSFCPTAKGLLIVRDELELINGELRHEMPLIKFLDEGRAPWRKCSHAKGKGQEKGKHSDKRKGRPQRASPKENPAESKASSV